MHFKEQYYRWAKQLIENEVKVNFSLIKGFQTSVGERFLYVLNQIPEYERLTIWRSLLKRFHVEGAQLCDPLTDEDRAAIRRYDQLLKTSFAELPSSSPMGPLAKKNDFQAAVKTTLDRHLGVKPKKSGGSLLTYLSKHNNLLVETCVSGGGRLQLSYWHKVVGPNQGVIHEGCSAMQWMGIASQTSWTELGGDRIEPVAAAVGNAVAMFVGFCSEYQIG